MTTTKKLWLGFGTLTALLVLVVVGLILNLRSIQGRMNEMTKARDRSAATRELEINVLDYAVGALLHLDTGDPKALQATAKDAADVERNLADYIRLATTDRHREMAAHFAALWSEYKELGQFLIDAKKRQAEHPATAKFHAIRHKLERLLDDEVQKEAVDEYEAQKEAASQAIQHVIVLAVILLAVGMTIAVLTSVLVSKGIVKAEQSLGASEELFRSLATSAPVGIFQCDREGRAIYFNQRCEDILRLTVEQAAQRAWVNILHPEDRARVVSGWDEAVKTGTEFDCECRYLVDGDKVTWGLTLATVLWNQAGEVTGFIGTVTDITERKQAEEASRKYMSELAEANRQLVQVNGELEQFAYVASHDLKAPLRAIDNLAQWIEEDVGETLINDSRRHFQTLRQRVNRMEALLDGLLQYSRIGRVLTEPEEIDTGALVHEIVGLIKASGPFTIHVAPDLPKLHTSRVPLQQVLLNLIVNAVKHHHRSDGRVEISALSNGTMVEFTVADDGPGIAPKFHERIFGMFQTLKPRDQVDGTGMGLALVKKTVENQGGRIWVESQEGSGARFRFTWPKNRVGSQ